MTIDDFKKMDLRVGVVSAADRVPDSEKLIRLEVDLGELGRRQIVAGIAAAYTAEELVGKQIVVVVNLEPRRIRGLESQGMLLAAHDADDNPILLISEKEVPPGSGVS